MENLVFGLVNKSALLKLKFSLAAMPDFYQILHHVKPQPDKNNYVISDGDR